LLEVLYTDSALAYHYSKYNHFKMPNLFSFARTLLNHPDLAWRVQPVCMAATIGNAKGLSDFWSPKDVSKASCVLGRGQIWGDLTRIWKRCMLESNGLDIAGLILGLVSKLSVLGIEILSPKLG